METRSRTASAVQPTGLLMGAFMAKRAMGPSIVPATKPQRLGNGVMSFAAGYAAGTLGELSVEQLDKRTGLSRQQSRLAVMGGGAAAMLAGHSLLKGAHGALGGVLQTAGLAFAVAGGVGGAVDGVRALEPDSVYDVETNIPYGRIVAGTAAVGAVVGGVKFGPKFIHAINAAKGGMPLADVPGELIPRSTLGIGGRNFITGTITEGVSKVPVRTYVPMKLAGAATYQERNAIGVEQLVKQGAFDKRAIVIYSPTGTGSVNPALVQTQELLADGDVASVVAQYSNKPSIFSLNKTQYGTDIFTDLAKQVAAKRAELYPNGGGPDIYAGATSLGALTIQNALHQQGAAVFDPAKFGIKRVLLFGTPDHLTKFRPADVEAAYGAGSVKSITTLDDIKNLTQADVDGAKVISFRHPNDPIGLMDPRIAVQRPDFLGKVRPEGVPAVEKYTPITSLLQTTSDTVGAISVSSGPNIREQWHDYRLSSIPQLVRKGYDHPGVTDEQLAKASAIVNKLETDRATALQKQLGLGGK